KNIAAGPANESTQTLNFVVTVADADKLLFSVLPAIDPATGNLTFKPAANAHGTVAVTVTLKDGSGTANGGSDTSISQQFNIVITKPHVWHNTLHGLDVDGNGIVVAKDALDVINRLNAFGPGAVPAIAAFGPPYYDTDNNGII